MSITLEIPSLSQIFSLSFCRTLFITKKRKYEISINMVIEFVNADVL